MFDVAAIGIISILLISFVLNYKLIDKFVYQNKDISDINLSSAYKNKMLIISLVIYAMGFAVLFYVSCY